MPNKQKLTKAVVEKCQPETGTRIIVWDTEVPGFGLRVTGAGRTYFVRYRAGTGRTASRKDFTIGKHGAPWTVENARKEARKILGRVAEGQDPQAEKVLARIIPNARTFEDVARQFLDRHVMRNLRPSTARDYRSILENKLIPAWQRRDISDIGRPDIHLVLDKIHDRAPVMARLSFAVMRRLFGFAMERGIIDENPCNGMKAPAAPRARDRVLDEHELAAFWESTEAMGWPFRQAFRLLLLTGQRRSEVSGMRWSEIDLEKGEWVIPAERSKNGKEHVVDLSSAAMSEIDAAPRIGPFVFGKTGQAELQGWSKAKKVLDGKIRDLFGIENPVPGWRVHDLRRTAASGMAGMGVGPHVVERVLNHVSGAQGGLVGVYQRYEYREERRNALMAWEERVLRLTGDGVDGAVVDLMKRRRAG